MKVRFSFLSLVLLTTLFAACSEENTQIGGIIMPNQDLVSTEQAVFPVVTRSVKTGAVVANTNSCYLGSIVDPETRAKTTAGFLAQFHVQENYKLPHFDKMLKDESGHVMADSCILRVLHDEYLGDSLATMKLTVQELDTNRVMEENTTYYTDIDPTRYINPMSPYKKTVTYSPYDQTKSTAAQHNQRHYRSIPVRLDSRLGSFILNKYYENPTYFSNSHRFARHVCAGFYFEHTGGLGAMIKSDITTLDIYFRYQSKTKAGKDTIVAGLQRLGTTEEVIQNTRVDNEIPAHMLRADNPYTYIKTPAGIYTEATLPLADIISTRHYNDTINGARITFRTHNTDTPDAFRLPKPEYLLMLRVADMKSFFAKNSLPDNQTSFLARYDNEKGQAYTFDNISALLSVLRQERDQGAQILPTDNEMSRKVKWEAWEAKNPNWNKIALVPVGADFSTTTSAIGTTTRTLRRVRNAYGLSSVKLEGGAGNPIEISVIYSRFQK